MHDKRVTKRLMSIGVQRNDAAAFARTYRKILDAGMEGMFPEIVRPVMQRPLTVSHLHPAMMKVATHIPDYFDWGGPATRESMIADLKRGTAHELARKLVEEGVVVFQEEGYGYDKKLTGTLLVVMPGEYMAKGI